MTAGVGASRPGTVRHLPVIGGLVALAESAWMGTAQATDVLEQAQLGGTGEQAGKWRLPRLSLRGLLNREFTVAEATVIMAGSFLFSAFLGAVRQVLFNAQFGAGSDASAYYAAFRLPDTLFSLIAGGALSSAMIPVLLSTRDAAGEEAAGRLTNLVLTTLLAVFAVVVVVGELAAPGLVANVLAPGFDHHTSQTATALTRLMLIQPLVLVAGSVAIAVLNSRNQFLLTALSVASHNLGLIGGVVATREHPQLGIYGPTVGVIAGAVLQVLILTPGVVGARQRFTPAWDLHDSRLREVIALLIPNGLAVGVLYAGFIVDTAFASKVHGPALPAVQNAWLLAGLPVALLGQAVGQAAFPRLAAQAGRAEWARMRATVLRSLGFVVAMAVPAVAFLLLLGRTVIRHLFEHGSFHAHAGSVTFTVLAVYAVGLPAFVGTEVVTRGLIALRDTRTPLITNTVQVLGRFAIMAASLGSLGIRAIPMALVVMAAVETVVLGAVLLWKLRGRTGGTQPAPT